MAETKTEKKSTKELILDAAFSFCTESRYKAFSMSELAAKVGITKPAIYRHFKDKDAVYAGMYRRFLDALAAYLANIQQTATCLWQDTGEAVADLIAFFVKNPAYVHYMLGCIASEKGFEVRMSRDLEARGIQNMSGVAFTGDNHDNVVVKDLDAYIRAQYCAITVFCFIKFRLQPYACGAAAAAGTAGESSAEVFSANLVSLLRYGLKGAVRAESCLYPRPIGASRMAELDALCTITPDMLPPEDRFFTAFAAVAEKYKLGGITVERIADELGLAKSSLYEYFDNKNQMIKSLLVKEMTLGTTIVKEFLAEARTFSEYFYILMHGVFSFFRLRFSVIPLCGWFIMTSGDDDLSSDFDSGDRWIEKLGQLLTEDFHLQLPVNGRTFASWVAMTAVSLVMQGMERGFDQATLQMALKRFFCYLEYGTDGDALTSI